MRFKTRKISSLGLILFMVSSCASVESVGPPVERFWPVPPDPPVVSYLRNFSQPKDLGKRRGFFSRALEFIVGERQDPVMIRPLEVKTDGKGRVYVTDPGLQGVHIFDFPRKKYRQIFWTDKNRGRLLAPVGITLDKKGRIYVSDSRLNRIYVYNPKNLKLIKTIGGGEFSRVTGIAYDQTFDRLYAVDTGAHSILIFNPEGQLIKKFGKRGKDDGEFNFPTHVTVDEEGTLYVTDAMNFRVQIFDSEGGFAGTIGKIGNTIGSFSKPKGVAVDSKGHIYVVDGVYDTVQIFDKKGRLLMNFGRSGEADGDFWLPAGIAIDKKDRIFVANSYNKRVEVFQFLGEPEEN